MKNYGRGSKAIWLWSPCLIKFLDDRSPSGVEIDPDSCGDDELQNQDRRDTKAERLVQSLVVKDLHPNQRAYAAANGAEKKQRFFRDASGGFVVFLPFGFPLVKTKYEKCNQVISTSHTARIPHGEPIKAQSVVPVDSGGINDMVSIQTS